MAKAKKKTKEEKGFWQKLRKVLLILFIIHLVYIILLKWVYPPITITQLNSFLVGDGLKRDYISFEKVSKPAKLAVIASEDQLFPDHDGFDFKSIEKAMKHNQRSKSLRGASTRWVRPARWPRS